MLKKINNPKVSLILPTLNESGSLTPLVNDLVSKVNPREIIIVDDSSTDGTAAEAEKLIKKYKTIRFITNSPPLGLTGSIQKGIDSSSSALVAWMDADFSHPPQTLKKMLDKINSADIVVGSWLATGGRDRRKEISVRIMSFIINRICRYLFKNRFTAYSSGFILTKRSVLNRIRLKGDYGEYCINFLVRAAKAKFIIKEIPFVCISRAKGITKTSPNPFVFIRRGLKYLKMVISLLIYG